MVIIERLGAAVINLKFILLMLSLFLSMDILIRDKTKSRLQVLNTMRVCGISNNNCELQCYCLAIMLNVSCTSWKRLLRLLLKKIDLTPKKKTSKGSFNDKTRTNVGRKGNIDFTLKDSERQSKPLLITWTCECELASLFQFQKLISFVYNSLSGWQPCSVPAQSTIHSKTKIIENDISI